MTSLQYLVNISVQISLNNKTLDIYQIYTKRYVEKCQRWNFWTPRKPRNSKNKSGIRFAGHPVLKREEEGGSFKPFSYILNLGGILYQIEASYYALCLQPFKGPMMREWVVIIAIGFCPSLDLAILPGAKPIKKGFSPISFLKIISFTMPVNGSQSSLDIIITWGSQLGLGLISLSFS